MASIAMLVFLLRAMMRCWMALALSCGVKPPMGAYIKRIGLPSISTGEPLFSIATESGTAEGSRAAWLVVFGLANVQKVQTRAHVVRRRRARDSRGRAFVAKMSGIKF